MMRLTVSALIVAVAAGLFRAPAAAGSSMNPFSHCGTERWAAKTLSDGTTIDFSKRTSTTVARLIALPVPSGVAGLNAPRVPEETRVYAIHALLQKYTLETDWDFHLVISDFGGSSSATMIAEIPYSKCNGAAGDGFTSQFDSMRSAIEHNLGKVMNGQWDQPEVEVTITGVLFFDRKHGQNGVAPNAVELHPVIALAFGSSPAPRTAAPSAFPSGSPSAPPTAVPATSPGPTSSPPIREFSTARAVQQHCPHDTVVWLNTRTGIYHRKGHPWYGTTMHGAYVCEREARAAGYSEGS